jgi:hypothetical protein
MSAENEEVEASDKIIDKQASVIDDVIVNRTILFPSRSGRLYLRTKSCLYSFYRAVFVLYRIYFLCLYFFFQYLLPRHLFYYAFSLF